MRLVLSITYEKLNSSPWRSDSSFITCPEDHALSHNLVLYHEILAPHSRWRGRAVT